MRSHPVRALFVSLFLVSMLAVPASAAPREGDGPFIQRVVRAVKHVLHLVTIASDELSVPRP